MEKVSCAQRVKLGLDIRGLKPADLCRMTGISKSTMSQYISGLYEPGQIKTELMARALHVDEAWLMGYDVPMEKEKPAALGDDELKSDELELIDAFRSAPQSTQEAIRLLLKGK